MNLLKLKVLYVSVLLFLALTVAPSADQAFRSADLKHLGLTFFPLTNSDNPRAIIAAYVVPEFIELETQTAEGSEYLRRAFQWACNARHFGKFLGKNPEYIFAQVHIFIAHQPPKDDTLDKGGGLVDPRKLTKQFEYHEKSYEIVDSSCGLAVSNKTDHDGLKISLARLLFGSAR